MWLVLMCVPLWRRWIYGNGTEETFNARDFTDSLLTSEEFVIRWQQESFAKIQSLSSNLNFCLQNEEKLIDAHAIIERKPWQPVIINNMKVEIIAHFVAYRATLLCYYSLQVLFRNYNIHLTWSCRHCELVWLLSLDRISPTHGPFVITVG